MRFLIFLLLATAMGCSVNGLPVHIVIPTGFSGEVRIVHDERHGAEVAATNGSYVYTIPADGVLYVKSLDPFTPMHRETASFADGSALPMEHETWTGPNDEPAKVGKDVTVLSGGGMSAEMNKPSTITMFVGTTIEYEQWQQEQVEAIGISPATESKDD